MKTLWCPLIFGRKLNPYYFCGWYVAQGGLVEKSWNEPWFPRKLQQQRPNPSVQQPSWRVRRMDVTQLQHPKHSHSERKTQREYIWYDSNIFIYTVYTTKLVNKASLPSTQNYHQLWYCTPHDANVCVPVLPFALPRLRIIEIPQPILLESKEPCRGPQGARNWKKSTAAILWGFLFLISFCIHEWILIFHSTLSII